MGTGPRSNAQSSWMLLPAAVAVATAAFSLVSAHDAAAQGFGGRFGMSRGGGFGASNSMMQPRPGFQKLRPGMGKGSTGKNTGKITGGRVTHPGKVSETGPRHPRPPRRPKGKRPPGIFIAAGIEAASSITR